MPPPPRPAVRIASRTCPTRVACWEVASPPDWASAASTVICSACPSADCPASRTDTTRGIRASEPLSRATKASSGPVSVPLDRAPTTVTAVSAAPCSGEASRAACWLGALAGRNEVLSLCVTLDSDGSSAMAAAAPAAQASTMAQRKRTASCPVAAKKVLTKAIVAGRGAAPLGPGERKVASWQIRTGPEPTGRRRVRFPNPQGFTGSVTSAAG